jgi:hypothetical protein
MIPLLMIPLPWRSYYFVLATPPKCNRAKGAAGRSVEHGFTLLNRSAAEIPTQPRIKCHKDAKIGQDKNIWCVVSTPPQPVTQSWESGVIIWRRTKLSRVGSLLRSNRHANTDTFKRTCLCQSKSVSAAASETFLLVSKVYAPRTL